MCKVWWGKRERGTKLLDCKERNLNLFSYQSCCYLCDWLECEDKMSMYL